MTTPTSPNAIIRFLNEGNLIHSVSDMFLQPNRQAGVKINRRWQPHPYVSETVTDEEFASFLKEALLIDAEYPLSKDLLDKPTFDTEDMKVLNEKRDFAFFANLDGIQYRVRGHLGQDYNGPCLDIRILKSKVEIPDQLGFPVEMAEKMLDRNRGLILISGKTGSGKSTTLSALAFAFATRYPGSKIITLEDPVEYVLSFPHAVISQKQVGVHVDSWASGVFHAKREQPDLLIVGEMRDDETIQATIDAAGSGMLVITTTHADRFDRAIDAILNAYAPEKHDMMARRLAHILRGIVVQQLIPSVEKENDFALPSLGYDIFLNEPQRITSAIQKKDWSSLTAEESNSYYPLRRRLDELVEEQVISKSEADKALHQYLV